MSDGLASTTEYSRFANFNIHYDEVHSRQHLNANDGVQSAGGCRSHADVLLACNQTREAFVRLPCSSVHATRFPSTARLAIKPVPANLLAEPS